MIGALLGNINMTPVQKYRSLMLSMLEKRRMGDEEGEFSYLEQLHEIWYQLTAAEVAEVEAMSFPE